MRQGCAQRAVEKPSRTGGDGPRVLRYDRAASSNDLRARTIATILDLVCGLVTVDGALFCAIDERLQKYAADPIVAKINCPQPVDIDEALHDYRHRWARDDPFDPRRVAASNVTVLSAQDVGGVFRRSQCASEAAARVSLVPVAEMYLRAASGDLAAAITLMRDPSAPDLVLSEIHMLRTVHDLCEHSYRLATRISAPGTNVLQTSGLTARQREVLMLAVRGASNSDISATLKISLATVKTHLRHAFRKLGVADRHEALLLLMNARPPQPVSRRAL